MDPEVSAGVVHSLIPYESHESDRFGRSVLGSGRDLALAIKARWSSCPGLDDDHSDHSARNTHKKSRTSRTDPC